MAEDEGKDQDWWVIGSETVVEDDKVIENENQDDEPVQNELEEADEVEAEESKNQEEEKEARSFEIEA
jgi:hypothetical protein